MRCCRDACEKFLSVAHVHLWVSRATAEYESESGFYMHNAAVRSRTQDTYAHIRVGMHTMDTGTYEDLYMHLHLEFSE